MRNYVKEILTAVDKKVTFIRRSAIQHIFGVTKEAVADVMDAHLETLSMVFLTTCWAIGYGWFEAVIGIGFLLGIPGAVGGKVQWYSFLGGLYSSYHLFLGFTIFCITFGIGFLKFNRMLYYRKRYLLFTSLASYPWALTVQDFAYFFFSPIFNAGNYELNSHAWTCQGLNLGCVVLANPWKSNADFIIPRWYGVTLAIAAVLFFLAYRSALVNLLVTRQVMKEAGYLEKIRVPVKQIPVSTRWKAAPERSPSPAPPIPPKVTPQVKPEVTRIVDEDHEALVRKLRERLERTGGT
ncbi:MAG: hypothetical protein ABSE39_04565 [Candidatus Bathyarchaeia archaeon]